MIGIIGIFVSYPVDNTVYHHNISFTMILLIIFIVVSSLMNIHFIYELISHKGKQVTKLKIGSMIFLNSAWILELFFHEILGG